MGGMRTFVSHGLNDRRTDGRMELVSYDWPLGRTGPKGLYNI